MANLVAKSLITSEVSTDVTRYRLLDTTRAYAREKLAASGEVLAVARKHAEHCRDLLELAGIESVTQNSADWLIIYGSQIENVREALDWAFSPDGDVAVGADCVAKLI